MTIDAIHMFRAGMPRAFSPLRPPRRYKGAKGGRGGAKSHYVAGRLVVDCLRGHMRVACLREIQNSIKDSVKLLIEDKIDSYGLGGHFKITDREMVGPNDSLFIFRGLQNHTATSIKSLESFNRVWYEEAQSLSKKSIEIATPTFRVPGTEQYFTWNPDQPNDPVETFFSENQGHPDFVCVTVNYPDNPWFPDDLRRDMERDRARDPDKYAHIWLGGYRKNSEARVFRNWKIERFETPADARFYMGADWGFSIDPTVLVRCFIVGRTLFIDREVWSLNCEIDRTPALFDKIPGARTVDITADSARPETISYMQRNGFPRMRSAVKGPGSIEDGIEFLKSYDIVIHPECRHVADEFSLFSWEVDKKTGEITNKLEEKKNHTIDSVRYALENVRRARQTNISEFRI